MLYQLSYCPRLVGLTLLVRQANQSGCARRYAAP